MNSNLILRYLVRASVISLQAIMLCATALGQKAEHVPPAIPTVLGSNFSYDSAGTLQLSNGGQFLKALPGTDKYSLSQMLGDPQGAETGIALDFHAPDLNGTISYGSYAENSPHPYILFLPHPVEIHDGRALLEIKQIFPGTSNDFFHFDEKGSGILGFRVMDSAGKIVYEGRVAFTGKGPYSVVPTVIEGPLINLLEPESCTISYETQVPVETSVQVNGKTFHDVAGTHHEIAVAGLRPETTYPYTVQYGDRSEVHSFKTAPERGSKKPFTFGFVADNRAILVGGEREFGGVNYQSARADIAAAVYHGSSFMQLMGGNTTGNNTSVGGHLLQYANLKRALEPFWSSIPVYVGMGNHEANYIYLPAGIDSKKVARISSFPYATDSGEATFAKAFVNPPNGPESEDGASYDPTPNTVDFPPYKENVYTYTYGNLAMIVLNSEYWKSTTATVNGNPEGYVMDQQLKWLDQTIQRFEADPRIDHVFMNLHSSVFPNGDHGDAGMWYLGSNDARPMVAGVRAEKGIIERRDQLIDISINKSKKVVGFLTGSEHNFALLEVTPEMNLYPANYGPAKLKINRTFVYINSGGGGAYAYAKMPNTPWVDKFQYFSAPPALALIHVDGKHVSLEVFNPETFEKICDNVQLR